MFRKLNQIIRRFSLGNPLFSFGAQQKNFFVSSRGQIGIVMILIVAVVLILYAVVINIGKVSQSKVITVIAANTAASKMASIVGSYGQALIWTYLKGETEYCQKTSVWAKIFSVIISIVLFFIAVLTGGWAVIALAALSLAFSTAALALDVMVIQPGITDMWNKMWNDSLDMYSNALEQGIVTALQAVVTDTVQIPDRFDHDIDGVFGDLADPYDKDSAPDYVSRFAYHYSKRLGRAPAPDFSHLESFLDALRDFVYKDCSDTTDWGLFDPLQCPDGSTHPCCSIHPWNDFHFPASCDICCVPLHDPEDATTRVRPECCDRGDCWSNEGIRGGNPRTCAARSFMGLHGDYPHVLEDYQEDSTNNDTCLSFHEMLGRDDEHPYLEPNPEAPSWDYDIPYAMQIDDPAAGPAWRWRDTTGFYQEPQYTPARGEDMRTSIFPFFYRMQWQADLSELTYGAAPSAIDDLQCYLCDQRMPPPIICPANDPPFDPNNPTDPLVLPNEPAAAPYSGDWCVDEENTGAVGEPPQLIDRVPNIPGLFADWGDCAQAPNIIGWKRGADRFCTTTWPYATGCAKHLGCTFVNPNTGESVATDCSCENSPSPASDWNEDTLDDLIYGLPEFFLLAKSILAKSSKSLYLNLPTWYDQIALWIEPPCPTGTCPGSFTKNPEGGALYVGLDILRYYRNLTRDWLWPTAGNEYVGAGCNISAAGTSVWCVPPDRPSATNKYADPVQPGYDGSDCPGVSEEEAATFDTNLNGIRGDAYDVLACLDWNIFDPAEDLNGDPIIDSFGIQVEGNAAKFRMCRWGCDNDLANATHYCGLLPRSLVPANATINFNALPFTPDLCSNSDWLNLLDQSIAAAENQRAKMVKRQSLLSVRMTDGRDLVEKFTRAIEEFTEFLNGGDDFSTINSPAEILINERFDFALPADFMSGTKTSNRLPSMAIYVWQDQTQEDGTDGKWHAVKVDARLPGRCGSGCVTNLWPAIKTKVSNWGTKRCYYLEGDTGRVLARAIRFDGLDKIEPMTFPDGTLLWQPRFGRPGVIPGFSNIESICSVVINGDEDIRDANWAWSPIMGLGEEEWHGGWKNAFMLNYPPGATVPDQPAYQTLVKSADYKACWDTIHSDMLKHGASTSTCAEYYVTRGSAGYSHLNGFRVRFVPCPDTFINGFE